MTNTQCQDKTDNNKIHKDKTDNNKIHKDKTKQKSKRTKTKQHR